MSKALLTRKQLSILIYIYAIAPIANAHPDPTLNSATDNICFAPPYSTKSCQAQRLSYTFIKNISLKGYAFKKSQNAIHAKIKRHQTTHCTPIKPVTDKNLPAKMLTLIPNLKFDLDVFALDPQSSNAFGGSPLFGVSINFRRCW